jgi:hypothetical protein
MVVSAVLAGIAVLAFIARAWLLGGAPDLGAVSDQWIAQHRADPPTG